MINQLIRWFVKDYQNTAHPLVRRRYGQFASIVGMATNLLLFVLKIIIGLLSKSIAITADAFNNLSDGGATMVSLIGFKLSGKPADAEHPYGHARMEYVAGLIVSFLVMFVGFELLIGSVQRILSPQETQPPSTIMLVMLGVSIFIKLWQCLFYKRVGRTISSSTLVATAADSRNDIIATSAVLVAAVITRVTGVDLDAPMGAVVAVFILVSGGQLVAETISPLLGTAPTRELVQHIHNKIISYEGIIGLHDLTVHSYGAGQCFASVHCELAAERDILQSHDLIDNIERDFLKEDNIHLVIHLDPVVTSDPKTNALKDRVMQLMQEISPLIDMHDFRVVWGVTHSNLIFDVAVPFDFFLDDDALRQRIAQGIEQLDENYHVVLTIDHDACIDPS